MSATNCGGLHIRTPKTDTILSPNIITQSIVSSGMRIGIIPETSVVGEFSYNIVIKNSSNNIIFQNLTPIFYTGYGVYLYIIVPFASLPSVGEVINIKLSSTLGCTTSTDYSVLSYTSSTDSTTTVNVDGIINKYLKLKPTISSNGYFKDNFYYFRCNSNVDTDDECFIQFKQNTDVSKVLTSLPTNTEIVSCPDSSDWLYVNTLCVSNIPVTTSTTVPVSTTTLAPCATGLKLDNIVYTSGTIYTIHFTSTNVQSINWKLFNNSNVQILTGSSGTLTTSSFDADFGTLLDGTYTLIIQATNCSSNIADGTRSFSKGVPSPVTTTSPTTTSTTTTSNSGVISFTNYLKSVPVESNNNKYSPQAFDKITVTNSFDSIIGKQYPNITIGWQVEGNMFSLADRRTPDNGIPFMYDWFPTSNGGYGVRCIDYVYDVDPNTGIAWSGDIDANCVGSMYDARYNYLAHSWQNFRTAIPFEQRAFGLYGKGIGTVSEWTGKTTTQLYDDGIESVASRMYGWGDKSNGKVNLGLGQADIENGFEDGSEKHLAFIIGMASSSVGYVFSQYSAPFKPIKTTLNYYPDDSGNFPTNILNIDGTTYIDDNPNSQYFGNPVPNNVPQVSDWNPTNKITVTGRFTNKGAIDYPNLMPCTEISYSNDMGFLHGTSNSYKTINKFGVNNNTVHPIAFLICSGDVNKWWAVNKLNNRKTLLQSKVLFDRNDLGNPSQGSNSGQSLDMTHFNRKYSFMIEGFTFFNGHGQNIWDRYTTTNKDCYNAVFGFVNLINQRKNFGGGVSKSFVDIFPFSDFKLWKSEISYDGGSTYVQDKATDYVLHSDKIPQRQLISTDGYWSGFLARPENTERTSCKLRILYGGQFFYYTVTPDMWETVDYDKKDVTLSNLPDSSKHYHYFLIKLDSLTTSAPTTTTSATTVNPNLTYQSVIVMVGESNAGSRNFSSTALSGELGVRSGVKILNNNTNTLQTIDIPNNSNFGENESVSTGWGWELQLANLRQSGQITKDIVIVKTAQGGALIGQYNTDITNGYYTTLANRINTTKTLLQAEGKTPIFYVMYSQGINNAIYPDIKDTTHYPNLSGIEYWKQATLDFLTNIRTITGANTKICLTKFFGSYGTYLNGAIDQIVATNSAINSSIVTNDLTTQTDGLHFDASSTKTVANRIAQSLNYFTTSSVTTTSTTTVSTTTSNGTDGFNMTQPNKAQYYFSNNHDSTYYNDVNKLPAIHTSETNTGSVPSGKLLSGLTMPARYDKDNDLVWLKNNYIKIGINLKRGGHIAWASLVGSTTNLVYNGYDGGFQIGLDAYEKPDGYTQEGQTAGQEIGTIFSYNVTHGGDFKNNSVSLIDYHPTTNGYYVKFRPILYPMRGLISESYIEVTYTLTTNAVKCDYVYTSFRTDAQRYGGIVPFAIPACFLINTLDKYATYNGTYPFTRDSNLTKGNCSEVDTAGKCGEIVANVATEDWVIAYNQTTGIGLGVYNADKNDRVRLEVKQCEVYLPDKNGNEFAGGFTYISPTYSYFLPANTSFTKSSTAYVIIGTIDQVRDKAYQLHSI